MQGDRPVNLDLTKFSFPLAALASITHRVSGVVLFVGLAFMLYAADRALASPSGFAEIQALMAMPLAKFITFGLLAALGYHLVAGIKHLFLDFHIGDSLRGGQIAAQIALVCAVVVIVLAGVWVYGY